MWATSIGSYDESRLVSRAFSKRSSKALFLSINDADMELVIGPLSKPSVRKMLPIFKDKARELSVEFDTAIGEDKNGVVEVEALMNRTAFKVISTALLSRDITEFRSSSSPLSFEECYRAVLVPPLLGKLITFLNPFIPLRWLPIEANRAFIRANTALRGMLTELVEERVQQVQQDKKSGQSDEKADTKDFLTKLIEANLAEKKSVSDQMLVDLVSGFPVDVMTNSGTDLARPI